MTRGRPKTATVTLKYLASWRKAQLLKQGDLSERLGVPQSLVSRYEHGHPVTPERAQQIADMLTVGIEELQTRPPTLEEKRAFQHVMYERTRAMERRAQMRLVGGSAAGGAYSGSGGYVVEGRPHQPRVQAGTSEKATEQTRHAGRKNVVNANEPQLMLFNVPAWMEERQITPAQMGDHLGITPRAMQQCLSTRHFAARHLAIIMQVLQVSAKDLTDLSRSPRFAKQGS